VESQYALWTDAFQPSSYHGPALPGSDVNVVPPKDRPVGGGPLIPAASWIGSCWATVEWTCRPTWSCGTPSRCNWSALVTPTPGLATNTTSLALRSPSRAAWPTTVVP